MPGRANRGPHDPHLWHGWDSPPCGDSQARRSSSLEGSRENGADLSTAPGQAPCWAFPAQGPASPSVMRTLTDTLPWPGPSNGKRLDWTDTRWSWKPEAHGALPQETPGFCRSSEVWFLMPARHLSLLSLSLSLLHPSLDISRSPPSTTDRPSLFLPHVTCVTQLPDLPAAAHTAPRTRQQTTARLCQ